eukprot:1183967-Prymnesium_polylepis.1
MVPAKRVGSCAVRVRGEVGVVRVRVRVRVRVGSCKQRVAVRVGLKGGGRLRDDGDRRAVLEDGPAGDLLAVNVDGALAQRPRHLPATHRDARAAVNRPRVPQTAIPVAAKFQGCKSKRPRFQVPRSQVQEGAVQMPAEVPRPQVQTASVRVPPAEA